MRATCVVVWHPLVQEMPQVVLGERDHEIQAFPPQPAQQPLAEGVRLGAPHGGSEYPHPRWPMLWSSCDEKMRSRS